MAVAYMHCHVLRHEAFPVMNTLVRLCSRDTPPTSEAGWELLDPATSAEMTANAFSS